MKYSTAIGCIAALCAALTGNVNAASAQFDGTLDLTTLQYPVTIEGTTIDAAVDLLRFDLGTGWSGNMEVLLTTSPYHTLFTTLGIALTTDPNDSLFSDPSPFLAIANTADASDFFNDNVNGWVFYSWGSDYITSGGTSDVTASFDPPLQFDLNSHYYAFVAGGTVLPTGTTVDVGLEVSSVPVPAAVWLFGSGIVGLIGIGRRKKAAG